MMDQKEFGQSIGLIDTDPGREARTADDCRLAAERRVALRYRMKVAELAATIAPGVVNRIAIGGSGRAPFSERVAAESIAIAKAILEGV
jgi:hypothetical protein